MKKNGFLVIKLIKGIENRNIQLKKCRLRVFKLKYQFTDIKFKKTTLSIILDYYHPA